MLVWWFWWLFLGLAQDFLNVESCLEKFSGLTQKFCECLTLFGNLLRKQWNILRKKSDILRKMEHFEKNPAIFERNPAVCEKKSFLFKHPSCYFSIRPVLLPLGPDEKKWNMLRKTRVFLRKIRALLRNIWFQPELWESPLWKTSVTGQQSINRICKRHLVKWQVARGSFKKVYLSQIFANVSKNTFFSGNIFFLTFGEC